MLNEACMEKMAAGWFGTAAKTVGSFVNKAKPMVKNFAGTNVGQKMIQGAKTGAGWGAISAATTTPAPGQSRVGNTIKSAVGGAFWGGAATGAYYGLKSPTFKNAMGNLGNKINNWGQTNMPKVSPGKLAPATKTASEFLEELYQEKLAGAGLTIGATGGAIGGAIRGASKGYAKNGIKGAIKSGLRGSGVGMMGGALAGALLDRISSPPKEEGQNPNSTQNFNG